MRHNAQSRYGLENEKKASPSQITLKRQGGKYLSNQAPAVKKRDSGAKTKERIKPVSYPVKSK